MTFLFYGASKCRTVQKERRKFKTNWPLWAVREKSKRRWKGRWKFSARCAVWSCERAQRRRQQCGGFGGRSEWVALLTTAAAWLLKGWDGARGRCDTPLVPPEGSRPLAELQSGSSCSDVSPDRPALHPSSPFSLFLCWLFFSSSPSFPLPSGFFFFNPAAFTFRASHLALLPESRKVDWRATLFFQFHRCNIYSNKCSIWIHSKCMD